MKQSQTQHTIIQQDYENIDLPTIQKSLESKDDSEKIKTLQKIIIATLNGQILDSIFMHVIRFVLPTKNKFLKKLLFYYYEVCPKYNENGNLKQEMIMVCNSLRNDLNHPNEFIRGCTLKFICKLKENELLEPCIPSVKNCLEHRLSYVRKNAILAIYSIYKTNNELIPNAVQILKDLIKEENDTNCKKNAFLALTEMDLETAYEYFDNIEESVVSMDENFQLAVVDFLKKYWITKKSSINQINRCLLELLETQNTSVRYESANVLIVLGGESCIKKALFCLLDIVNRESDNNVKLIVLEKIDKIKELYNDVIRDMTLDFLNIFSKNSVEIKQKVMAIVLSLLSDRNVNEIVSFLKQQIMETLHANKDEAKETKNIIIAALYECANRHKDSISKVIDVLLKYLNSSEIEEGTDIEVINFMKKMLVRFPFLQKQIITNFLSCFKLVKSTEAKEGAFWIISEYCTDPHDILLAANIIMDLDNHSQENKQESSKKSRKILEDGTYATEAAYYEEPPETTQNKENSTLELFDKNIYFMAAILCSTLTKLIIRLSESVNREIAKKYNSLKAKVIIFLIKILRKGCDKKKEFLDKDSLEKITTCIKLLTCDAQKASAVYMKSQQLYVNQASEQSPDKKIAMKTSLDEFVSFGLLKISYTPNTLNFDKDDINSVSLADLEGKGSFRTKLDNIFQLSGYSDPIYVETVIEYVENNIYLSLMVVNQTEDLLQNVRVDFTTVGDLKVLEQPQKFNISANDFHYLKCIFRVSSTDTGVIFGNVTYDISNSQSYNFMMLSEIKLDIMKYIRPISCTEQKFREMWAELEWENKVSINTKTHKNDLHQFLKYLLRSTSLKSLTNFDQVSSECGFLSANLYAQTSFNEDVLANISIEYDIPTESIVGHVRIRSKKQGLALNIGETITSTLISLE